MLQESFATAEADMPLRALREARVDAERMVGATRAALQADADLLQPGEREGIERLLAQAEQAAAGEDRDAIEAATLALAEGTEHFAAERMNRGIRRALAGRSVEEV